MFKSREIPDAGQGGYALGAVALRPGETSPRYQLLPHNWHQRWHRGSTALSRWLAHADWAPDLAENIGTMGWLRGMATMLGLCGLALAFWPDLSSVPALPAQPLTAAARNEFRSQLIPPLASGGDRRARAAAGAAVAPVGRSADRPIIQTTAALGQADSVASLLQRLGATPADAIRAEQLVASAVPPAGLAVGTRLDVTLGQGDSVSGTRRIEHLALRARFDLNLALVRTGAGLVLTQHPIAIDTTPLRIRGVIGASIYRSARASGAPIEAIQQYLQVLDQHLSLDTGIEPGDTFDIIVASKRTATGEAQVGELLFAGLEHAGRPTAQLLRWGREGQFFEASSMGAQRTGLIMPVVGHVTSNFGARRHPILGYTRMHAGVDFGATYGAPIYAVGDGMVTYSGWHGGHGNYVRLDHGGGYGTGYAHMSRIAVASGNRVRAGQVIGYVGSTGLSTGPHLHYELYRGGIAVNPLTVRFTVSNQVDVAELAAFRARIGQLKALRQGGAKANFAVAGPAFPQVSPVPTLHREIDKLRN